MADAEKLLHEAQYAFQCISFGESRENTRNRSRAKSLCMKIIKKFPATMEAGEAHAILRRLGEEAYTSQLSAIHRHTKQSEHHRPKKIKQSKPLRVTQRATQRAPDLYEYQAQAPRAQATSTARTWVDNSDDSETLNWGGLVSLLFGLPKAILGLIVFAGFFLFGILGPFLFVPLVLFFMFSGPFRKVLKPGQQQEMNAFVARLNDYIDKRQSGL